MQPRRPVRGRNWTKPGAKSRGAAGGARMDALRAERARLRKAAGVTNAAFDMAWMGRLNNPGDRARLWAAIGLFPAERGIVLTDDGGQEIVR